MENYFEAYRYRSLGPCEIRILHIRMDHLENPEDITADLECSLEAVPLQNCNEFVAISYTWGSSLEEERIRWSEQIFTSVRNCYPIYVGGKLAFVTRSSRNALRRVRQVRQRLYIPENADPRAVQLITAYQSLWIDGLCIDQRKISNGLSKSP